jgi:hypothetical protein
MPVAPVVLLAVLASLVPLLSPRPAGALRCPGGIVSEGDRKVEVLARCGEPAQREVRPEESALSVLDLDRNREVLDERRETATVEEWAYNFGPTQLLYFVTFRNGKVADIQTGGYGFALPRLGELGPEGWGESAAVGRRKLEVLRSCGEPASVDRRYVERARTVSGPRPRTLIERRETVAVEEWTFNFGPNRLLYVFTFENGKVVRVETAGYGY